VRAEIASVDGSRAIQVDRSVAAAELLSATRSEDAAVVAHDDSGVGKSALVIRAVTGATPTLQKQCASIDGIFPRRLWPSATSLSTPLAKLLAELSGPARLLVIDVADAISEGLVGPFGISSTQASKPR
jgi:hypothetical protein